MGVMRTRPRVVPLPDLYRRVYTYDVADLGETLFALAGVAIRRRDRSLGLTAASTLVTAFSILLAIGIMILQRKEKQR